jgi:tetratricopeptide (TPR) repeat protein
MLWFRAMALSATTICPALNARGKLERDQGRFDEAEQHHRRCLALVGNISLPLDPQLNVHWITALEGLAALYESQGRASDAAPVRERIQQVAESLSRSVNDTAKVRHDQGHIDEAEVLYKRSVALADAVSNLGDPLKRDLVTALNGLAAIYDTQGRAEEAAPLRQRAKAIEENTRAP